MRAGRAVVLVVVLSTCIDESGRNRQAQNDGDGGRDAGVEIVDAGADAGTDACVALTCASARAECGVLIDGCGGTVDCGVCPAGLVCGTGGSANACGLTPCVPTTCAAQQKDCGMLSDGCGQVLECGSCSGIETCGALVPNECGCRPATCASRAATCGSFPDGCGARTSCGTCGGDQVCGSRTPGVCGPQLVCTTLGWCHEYPANRVPYVIDMWANGPDDLWVAGGPITHWDGARWESLPLPESIVAQSIFGFATDDVWAVGSAKVAHFDGFEWKVVAPAPGIIPSNGGFAAVHGLGPNDLWFSASPNVVARRFNGNWSSVRVGTGTVPIDYLFSPTILALSPTDVWAGSYHLTSAGWVTYPQPGGAGPYELWASSATNIWAAPNSSGPVWHWDGGGSWTEMPGINAVTSVAGTGADDVWFVTNLRSIARYDGSQFTTRPVPLPGVQSLTSIAAPERERPVLGTNTGSVLRVERDGGITQLTSGELLSPILDMWWNGNAGAAVGADFYLTFDGAHWISAPLPPTTGVLRAVAGTSASLVYVGALVPPNGGELLRWDGTTWTAELLSSPVNAIWAAAANDVWVFSTLEFRHWDGTTWTTFSPPAPRVVVDVAASGSNLLALTSGSVLTWDGSSWTEAPLGMQTTGLQNISVWSASDVWAAGNNSLFHFDGASWLDLGTPNARVSGVVAIAPSEAWVVTEGPLYLWKLNPFSLTEVETGLSGGFQRVEISNGQVRMLRAGAIIKPP
ncbi:MAG: hypothetical protein JNM17_13600 [Archangium sp.]|nr:hypothetical protein [Archangium sp.]